MLPLAVRQGSSASVWNTKPMRVAGPLPSVTCPPDSGISPAIAFNRVDLPHPLGPTMATNSPGAAPSETCSTAVTPASVWPARRR